MRPILTASWLHCVGWVHPLGNNSRHTVAAHGYAVEHIGDIHRRFLVRNDDELGILAQLFEKSDEATQVDIVKRCFNLIHDIKR